MIGELLLIQRLKHPYRIPRTDDDKRRETEYGVSQEDVLSYLQMYKNPLVKPPDYPRIELDDDNNWKKAKGFLETGEMETVKTVNNKLIRTMRFYGVLHVSVGIIIVIGSIYVHWLWSLLGVYFLAKGLIRSLYIPFLIRRASAIKDCQGIQ